MSDSTSIAEAGDGIEAPDNINVLNIHENEDSHGSPVGESGLIVLWDGGDYDPDESWIKCDEESVCDLGAYQ